MPCPHNPRIRPNIWAQLVEMVVLANPTASGCSACSPLHTCSSAIGRKKPWAWIEGSCTTHRSVGSLPACMVKDARLHWRREPPELVAQQQQQTLWT